MTGMSAPTSDSDQHLLHFLACRPNIQNDAEWLEVNLGPFVAEVGYSALRELGISGVRHILIAL